MLPWVPPSPQSLSAFTETNSSSTQPFNFTPAVFPYPFFAVWETSTFHLNMISHPECDTTTILSVPPAAESDLPLPSVCGHVA